MLKITAWAIGLALLCSFAGCTEDLAKEEQAAKVWKK